MTNQDDLPENFSEKEEDPKIIQKIIKEQLISLNPKKLMAMLDKYVIGQYEAKKVLSVAVYNHLKRLGNKYFPERCELIKSNVLMIGPTGTGKTFLIESLCKELDLPFGIADATTLTETGYWGDDVESVLIPLIEHCNNDLSYIEGGIVYIDEIDKIAMHAGANGKDITGRGVQRSLLKIIEGKPTDVITSKSTNYNNSKSIKVNTKNILFIVGGAFSGIEDIIQTRLGARQIGFNVENKLNDNVLNLACPEDFITYGFIPEFMGRLHNIARLDKLTLDDLIKILTIPENNLVDQYKNLFWHDGITLMFEQDALELIAEHALKNNTGARGLRTIMEKALLDIMFTAPTESGLLLTITKDMIKDKL